MASSFSSYSSFSSFSSFSLSQHPPWTLLHHLHLFRQNPHPFCFNPLWKGTVYSWDWTLDLWAKGKHLVSEPWLSLGSLTLVFYMYLKCLVRLWCRFLIPLSSQSCVTYRCYSLPCWSHLQRCSPKLLLGNKWRISVCLVLSCIMVQVGPWTCIVGLEDCSWSLWVSHLDQTLWNHSCFMLHVEKMSLCWWL